MKLDELYERVKRTAQNMDTYSDFNLITDYAKKAKGQVKEECAKDLTLKIHLKNLLNGMGWSLLGVSLFLLVQGILKDKLNEYFLPCLMIGLAITGLQCFLANKIEERFVSNEKNHRSSQFAMEVRSVLYQRRKIGEQMSRLLQFAVNLNHEGILGEFGYFFEVEFEKAQKESFRVCCLATMLRKEWENIQRSSTVSVFPRIRQIA